MGKHINWNVTGPKVDALKERGIPTTEIAKILGIPASTIYNRDHRERRKERIEQQMTFKDYRVTEHGLQEMEQHDPDAESAVKLLYGVIKDMIIALNIIATELANGLTADEIKEIEEYGRRNEIPFPVSTRG